MSAQENNNTLSNIISENKAFVIITSCICVITIIIVVILAKLLMHTNEIFSTKVYDF